MPTRDVEGDVSARRTAQGGLKCSPTSFVTKVDFAQIVRKDIIVLTRLTLSDSRKLSAEIIVKNVDIVRYSDLHGQSNEARNSS